MSTKHQMNWEEAACLYFAANYHERMFLESWYTKRDNNSINICRDMPGAYYLTNRFHFCVRLYCNRSQMTS